MRHLSVAAKAGPACVFASPQILKQGGVRTPDSCKNTGYSLLYGLYEILTDWSGYLLSVRCISSIGQVTKSVCVSISKSVSQSVCHTKRVECSTDRNLPPMFTKLATKVESRMEIWRYGYLMFLVEIRNISIRHAGSGINPHRCFYGKNLNDKYLENGERYDVGLKGGQIGNHP